MRKGLLQRIAAEAAAGSDSPVARCACAPATTTPSTLPTGAQNARTFGAAPIPNGTIGGAHSTDDATSATANVEDEEYNLEAQRYGHHATRSSETGWLAEANDVRHADSSAGASAQPEAASTQPTWPDEPELLQLGRHMLTGGTGVPAAPGRAFEYAKADHVLLTRIENTGKALKKLHGGELHVVPGTTGRIDQVEARGYLLGAVLGRGLLTREQAVAAGIDARNKFNALEKRLATQKETSRRAAAAARKAGGDAPERHARDAANARSAIECEQVSLALPEGAPPPPPSRKRRRAHAPPRWFVMPTMQQVEAALDTAYAAAIKADKANDAAELVFDAAQSSFDRTWAAYDAADEEWHEHYMGASPAEEARLNAMWDRAKAKWQAAMAERQVRSDAWAAAEQEFNQKHEEHKRMIRWLERPNALTPFPWAGDEFVEPCNARDLDYYEGRPDACPPGVREWYARYESYLTPECDHEPNPAERCDACREAFEELGTMRATEKAWHL